MKKIILLFLPAIIAVGLLGASRFRTIVTKLIVPTQDMKTYETYLTPEKMELRRIEKKALEGGGPENIFVNGVVAQVLDGLTIVLHTDGSLTIDGTYEGEGRWLGLSAIEQYLDGDSSGKLYYFSDGGFSQAADGKAVVVFGGRNPDTEEFRVEHLLDVKTEHVFAADERYPHYYAGFYFFKGFKADHLSVRPMLCRAEKMDSQYEFTPCSMMYFKESSTDLAEYGIFHIPQKDFEEMPEHERKMFFRNLKNQYQSGMEWITVEFEDHTGIWFPDCAPEKAVRGNLDSLGRVNDGK